MVRSPSELDAIWYGDRPPPLWMRLGELLYRAGQPLHQAWQRVRSGHPGVPVVVVGNITAGGTGKTPLLIALVRLLLEAGARPGVVTRGYGVQGRSARELRDVHTNMSAADVGDEPLLIHRETGVPVLVHPDRLLAAQELARRHPVDIILSDDGLQHRRLERDLEIAVVDGERGLGNRRRLPAGPLRESPNRLEDVDFVVRNGGIDGDLSIEGDQAINLSSGQARPLASFADREDLTAVAGIGRPERFFKLLAGVGLKFKRHPLPDHFGYADGDPVLALAGTVLTTAKDAVKLRGRVGATWWEVPVSARLRPELAQQILVRMKGLIQSD